MWDSRIGISARRQRDLLLLGPTGSSKEEMDDKNGAVTEVDEYYMRQALRVAAAALKEGEVPVGCVLVLPISSPYYTIDTSVIVSHGANQVNACRDATRHAEIVAIDRLLTGAVSTDQLRLPQQYLARKQQQQDGRSKEEGEPAGSPLAKEWKDAWINEPDQPDHWKNKYGWGNGKLLTREELQRCVLYVTCEPCIMCAAALADVKVARVVFGCHNDKFGGCGSILNLQQSAYPVASGCLADEAVQLLRSFYNRENFHAPDDKRRKKDSTAKEERGTR